MVLNTAVGPPQQISTPDLKNEVGNPKYQVGSENSLVFERLCEDEKRIIDHHQHQRHRHTSRSLPTMRPHPQGNTHKGESNAGKRYMDTIEERQ